MKRILIAAALILSLSQLEAQQKQGTVTYERVSQMRARFNINGVENDMPQTRKDNFVLTFGNNSSLWKGVEQENEEDHTAGGGEGLQIRMVVAGSNDVLYNNFETGKKVEKRELFEKIFIVDDSIRSLKWKMTGETKTILNFPCMKATATNISKRTMMTMDDGKMQRKETEDTSDIVAWFTTSIPVSAGPAEYQGQLPGLILEMDIKKGTQTYKATGFSEKADLAIIKEPTGKKHYTPEEFKKEREKMMREMQENNHGGNRQIRIN
jgi:GLPGLI family protein